MPDLRSVRRAQRAAPGHRVLTLQSIFDELGVQPDVQLFELARVHRSWAYENGQVPTNERLEFLGDAVLQLVVTDHLYREYPDLSEGQLSKLRIAVVNAHALAKVARGLDIGPLIRLGRGEVTTAGHDKDSILADTTEAMIGAVYLSGGYPAAEKLIRHLFVPLIEAARRGDGLDHKTALQELAADQGLPLQYVVTGTGPDHAPEFTAHAHLGERPFGPGIGTTKRQAEQRAAKIAVTTLRAEAAAAAATLEQIESAEAAATAMAADRSEPAGAAAPAVATAPATDGSAVGTVDGAAAGEPGPTPGG